MKTLIILAIILGIFASYFIFTTEKSFSIKNKDGVIPAGINIAKFILNKTLDQAGGINSKLINTNGALQSKLAEEIKSKMGEIGNKISSKVIDLIRKPIENKIRNFVCPIR